MAKKANHTAGPGVGTIRTGIGGWVYPPWRQGFYPAAVKAADSLRYAASKLAAIEINATFHGTQKPESFARWAAEVPDGFVFSVKAARGAAIRKDPQEAAPAIARFLGSGLSELGDRLGPILWQLPAGRIFDASTVERFLDLLPDALDGLRLRHAIEAAHPSFRTAQALALLAARNVALVGLDKDGVDPAAPITADFVYLRLQRTSAEEPAGYAPAALEAWARRLQALAGGVVPEELAVAGAPPVRPGPHDVFAFLIAGAKERAPAAAMALATLV